MPFVIAAIALVLALLGGLFYLTSDDDSASGGGQFESQAESTYAVLPEIALPDYANVVTDDVQRERLEAEATRYIEALSGVDRGNPASASFSGNSTEVSTQGQSGGTFVSSAGKDQSSAMLVAAKANIQVNGQNIPLAHLLETMGRSLDPAMFYFVHSVDENDQQGIWGVVQNDLMTRFAQGVAINRGDDANRYTVLIPSKADETLGDGTSSFLGRALFHKSSQAIVYNSWTGERRYRRGIIIPGQDIVIVPFEREELIGIYQYFATRS